MSSAYRAIEYLIEIGPVIIIPGILFLVGPFCHQEYLEESEKLRLYIPGYAGRDDPYHHVCELL